jgi:GDP/UDP-N,N'-diacetylbacillosamine 2-epimerase (hydrolysing)
LQTAELLEALKQSAMQVVCLLPNSDAGNVAIRDRLLAAESRHFRTFVHLPRAKYLSWMAAADLMVGNSSSGIIEAASFGLPVVNVGDRQLLRERSGNVVDCAPRSHEIGAAIVAAAALQGRRFENVYGDGLAGERIVAHLGTIDLEPAILKKANAY